jgi:acyl-CoA synthetase (NDP forming)
MSQDHSYTKLLSYCIKQLLELWNNYMGQGISCKVQNHSAEEKIIWFFLWNAEYKWQEIYSVTQERHINVYRSSHEMFIAFVPLYKTLMYQKLFVTPPRITFHENRFSSFRTVSCIQI